MRRFSIVLAAVALAMTSPAFAMTVFLQRDLGVRDFMRHCQYSNGRVYTVNSMDLCPMTVEAGLDFAPPGQSSSGLMGFYKGEYADGMTKVCVYDVLGENRGIRVKSYELCPISPKF